VIVVTKKGDGYMTEVDRLEALKDKHDALEQVLTKLETIKQPDELEIQTVKKQKLHLKDEIAQLSR
jgi:uncharacterized protein YdcH (DUF465 family)